MTIERDDLDAILDALPPDLNQRVRALPELNGLLEIVMDLGRTPEARFAGRAANAGAAGAARSPALASRALSDAPVSFVTYVEKPLKRHDRSRIPRACRARI